MNAANLIKFIESHQPATAIDNGDGTLSVTGEQVANGVVSDFTETIAGTLQAARDWLGY